LPLAALLIATDSPGPRVLGTDPLEFQLRRARAAGVAHAVIYSERVTSPLLATVDRLRREGLSVDIARNVVDAAEFIHPDEGVMMIASDLIASPDRLAGLAASSEPVLLCVRDEPANDHFELIDPTARWTGFARIDGGLLRRTAAMVGDWDLGSTLMRRAVQEGAMRMTLTADEARADLIDLRGTTAAQRAGRQLVATTVIENAGWADHWLIAPAARMLARVVGELGIEAQWVTLAGFALFGLATACAMAGWILASLFILLLGQMCDAAGGIGAQAGAGTLKWEKFRFPVRATAAILVVGAMGMTLTLRTAQWGCLVVAAVVIGATWLARPLARDDVGFSRWRSDPPGHAVLGVLGFALGSPVVALAVSALHAAASLAWALRKARSGLARP
jgi:hypothetical protein